MICRSIIKEQKKFLQIKSNLSGKENISRGLLLSGTF